MTKVKVDFNGIEALNSLGVTDGRLQKLFATMLVTISDPYVPFRDGYLKNSAKINKGGREITYGEYGPSNKYARRWWYEGADFNGAPIRGNRWVTRAWNDNKDAVVNNLNARLRSGNL